MGYDFPHKMSFGLPNVGCRIGWIVPAVCLAASTLRAADPLPGAAIEFSEPGKGLTTTNLEPWRLPDVQEEEGYKDSMQKPDTLGLRQPSPLSPVRPGVLPNSRMREGERKEGLTLTADDMVQDYITQQVLKRQRPAQDRRLLDPVTLSGQALGLLPRDSYAEAVRNKGLFILPGSETEDKKGEPLLGLDYGNDREKPETLFNKLDASSPDSTKSLLSDLFEPGSLQDMSPEAVRLRKARLEHREQYKQLLGMTTPSFDTTLKDMLNPAAPAQSPPPRGGLNRYPSPARPDVFRPLMNANNAGVRRGPFLPTAPTAPLAPGLESSLAPEPVYAPPVVPRPTFSPPKRVF